MATTGTNTFIVTRDDIIKASLRVLQVIGVGETPVNEDYVNCSQALNIMIKGWANNEKPVWVLQNLEIPMVEGVNKYYLGPTGGRVPLITVTDGGSGYDASGTWTSTGGTSGTTASGTYTSTGGVIDSITVVNEGDSYTSNSLTLSFSGSGTGCTYTAYVAGLTISRPLETISAYLRDSNNYDTPVFQVSRDEYDNLGFKSSEGEPNQFYYDRQESNGVLYIYNTPSSSTDTLFLRVQRQFYDMDTSTDNFDFPEEFFQALKWGLAAELYLEYPVPENVIQIIELKAEKYIKDAFDNSVESADVRFSYSNS